MQTKISFENLAGIRTELLAVFAIDAQTAKGPEVKAQPVLLTGDEKVRNAAAAVLSSGEYKAGPNETVLVHAPAGIAAKRLLIVGLGKKAKATVHAVRNAAGTAVRYTKPRAIRELTIALPEIPADLGLNLGDAAIARAAAEGAFVGNFDADTYRSERKDVSVQSLTVAGAAGVDQGAIRAAFNEGVVIGESQNFTRTLVNEPGNKLTPTVLGQRAAEMCKEAGLKCEVFSTEKLHEENMGAFWSVSQGSAEPPALIVMTYEPEGAPSEPVLGLVGKGIT